MPYYQSLLLVLLLVYIEGLAEGWCSDPDWLSFRGSCVYVETEKLSWYAAEARCRDKGGHLLTESDPISLINARGKLQLGLGETWVGLYRDFSGKWKWSSGEAFDPVVSPLDLNKAPLTRNCGVLGSMHHTCHSILPSICELKGIGGCFHKGQHHSFLGYLSPERPLGTIEIHDNVLSEKEGEHLGIGRWITPSTFVVDNLSVGALSCTWEAVFSSRTIATGCRGVAATKSTIQCKSKGTSKKLSACSGQGILGKKQLEPDSNTEPDEWILKVLGSTGEEREEIKEREGSGGFPVPVWSLPLGFLVIVAGAAGLAVGAGALKRAAMRGSEGEEEKGRGSSGNPLSAPCTVCSNFDGDKARERFTKVRTALSCDVADTLSIISFKCHIIEGTHVHVFRLDNKLSPFTLGALTTLYSRKRPRPDKLLVKIETDSNYVPLVDDTNDDYVYYMPHYDWS